MILAKKIKLAVTKKLQFYQAQQKYWILNL